MKLILVKGAGDIGSAVAHGLKRAGAHPVLLERPRPLITRRRMAFAPILHGEQAVLEGLSGRACTKVEQVLACAADSGVVPVLEWEEDAAPPLPDVAAMVDARMKKKEAPTIQIGEAPLVIGIGPGFVAGRHAHGAVESNWGDTLGRVLWVGGTLDYTGQHKQVEGHGAERYLYAPHGGVFHTGRNVLEPIEAGEVAGTLKVREEDGAGTGSQDTVLQETVLRETALRVEISGVLRGLAHDGTPVPVGAKLVEVEPRGEARYCIGIAERPGRIADGVLEAIRARAPELFG